MANRAARATRRRIEARRPSLVALCTQRPRPESHSRSPKSRAARRAGALVVLDCVTSLSGMDVRFDEWQIDAA